MSHKGTDFTDQAIIVTGAGSGIGLATARHLAEHGAHVVVNDFNEEAGSKAVEEITAAGGKASAVLGDAADQTVIDALVAEASKQGKTIGLVNNAGVMDKFQGAQHTDDELWDRIIRVNLTAPFRLTRAVLPHMVAAGKGAIVNVGSAASLRGASAGAAYTASKHGLAGLTKNTAYTYAQKGVRANLVAPGGVDTGIINEDAYAAINPEEGMAAMAPIHQSAIRSATPEEIANGIVFLLSDSASNFNGAIIPFDAGWYAG